MCQEPACVESAHIRNACPLGRHALRAGESEGGRAHDTRHTGKRRSCRAREGLSLHRLSIARETLAAAGCAHRMAPYGDSSPSCLLNRMSGPSGVVLYLAPAFLPPFDPSIIGRRRRQRRRWESRQPVGTGSWAAAHFWAHLPPHLPVDLSSRGGRSALAHRCRPLPRAVWF